jgi:peroxiredoxin
MHDARALAEITVLDLEGNVRRLGELWRERPVVLVFVRHFGCLFCREQVQQLRPLVGDIRQRGAELAVVGNGSVEDAREFARELALDFPLFTDPRRLSYQAAGLRRGLASTLGPSVFGNAWRALREGHRQRHTQGDPWQQGGAFVIAPDHRLLYLQRSETGGDHADPQALLNALPQREMA